MLIKESSHYIKKLCFHELSLAKQALLIISNPERSLSLKISTKSHFKWNLLRTAAAARMGDGSVHEKNKRLQDLKAVFYVFLV